MDRSNYDVFLSFSGEDDTQNAFADDLYAALARNGITTFKDEDKEKSEASRKEILEESRLYIVIFSKSYASKSWCLDELLEIMERSKTKGRLVLPVYYYNFDPSNLRKQGPFFGKLFAENDMEKVMAWDSVLVEAANLSGLGLIDYRHQATQINEIVEMVLSKLNININMLHVNQHTTAKKHNTFGDTSSSHEKPPIGIDRRVQQVKRLLQEKPACKPPRASLSSIRSSPWTYDVLMCFKGNDTCRDFVDQLHYALEKHNIHAFRKDQALSTPNSIHSVECLKVIEESNIAVVVFSKGFVASAVCLDELVKIMNFNEGVRQSVFPIFYDVESSDVRNQKGLFTEAVMQNNPAKIESWRKALAKLGSLAGWYLNCTPKSDEATVIKSIVDEISKRLYCFSLSVDDNLIGIEARVRHVMSLLKLESYGVETIAIWGMGGIGKTTLARAVFDQVSTFFDSSCFVENIRETSKYHGPNHMQKEMMLRLMKDESLHVSSIYGGVDPIRELLAQRKVLIVLDDVDDSSQLEALVGSGKLWFGEGSRIIITTRDETLLVAHNIMKIYYVQLLNENESYQFLRRHAFKKDVSTKSYEDLFPRVIGYAAGLPLALKVLSSLLCGRSKKEWISTMARLQVYPEKAIQDRLKISYDSLTDGGKKMFLLIAWCLNDTEKDYAVKILDKCGFCGDIGIGILEKKSLIRILEGCINMPTLIQQMGRGIFHPDLQIIDSDRLMDGESMKEVDAIDLDYYRDQKLLNVRSNYDVFLSFSGEEDTQNPFADDLYAALARNGITTFKDEDKEKSEASRKEIEESSLYIVIFSKSYASKSWCLDELLEIMERSKTKGRLVLPVYYYNFDPSNLRKQGPFFEKLFAENDMKVMAWKSVLVEAANLSGLGISASTGSKICVASVSRLSTTISRCPWIVFYDKPVMHNEIVLIGSPLQATNDKSIKNCSRKSNNNTNTNSGTDSPADTETVDIQQQQEAAMDARHTITLHGDSKAATTSSPMAAGHSAPHQQIVGSDMADMAGSKKKQKVEHSDV
ncbi:hypothetical protein SSX86_016014 [Deinandra increscens subsp. villosa]|uniref:TIR domain-containing protein n=1 Tax=Deinandra increscens subsp. villosa TaxID=3103831 RepID=A0AAP0GY02_9ASTR